MPSLVETGQVLPGPGGPPTTRSPACWPTARPRRSSALADKLAPSGTRARPWAADEVFAERRRPPGHPTQRHHPPARRRGDRSSTFGAGKARAQRPRQAQQAHGAQGRRGCLRGWCSARQQGRGSLHCAATSPHPWWSWPCLRGETAARRDPGRCCSTGARRPGTCVRAADAPRPQVLAPAARSPRRRCARPSVKLARATHVIWNEGSLDELRRRTDEVVADLLAPVQTAAARGDLSERMRGTLEDRRGARCATCGSP